MLIDHWIDRVGDWNPQLFRELKSRLSLRSLAGVIALVMTAILVLFAVFYSQLPTELGYSHYCIGNDAICQQDANGQFQIDWPLWWRNLSRVLTWSLIGIAMVPTTFMLANNIEQEERQGTLNFIRLSPQSARSILVGKLLGVPILVYLGLLLVLPLHWLAIAQAQAPWSFLPGYYLMLAVGCSFLYSLALLCGLVAGRLPIEFAGSNGAISGALMGVFTLVVFLPLFIMWNVSTGWSTYIDFFGSSQWFISSLYWYVLPIGAAPAMAYGLTVVTLLIGSYWVWQGIKRQFNNPSATLLSKRQAMLTAISCEILFFGFCFQKVEPGTSEIEQQFALFIALNTIHFICCLILTLIVSTLRPVAIDWARYRHVLRHPSNTWETISGKGRSLFYDLMLGEKSPAHLMMSVLGVAIAIPLLVWLLTWRSSNQQIWALVTLACFVLQVVIYSSAVQFVYLSGSPKRKGLAFLTVSLIVMLPLLFAGALYSKYHALTTFLLLCSPLPTLAFAIPHSLVIAPFALLGQIAIAVLLNLRVYNQLKQLGVSHTKALLT